MFKVLVHVWQEARCKPLIHVIQSGNRSLIFTQELAVFRAEGGFPLRKQLRNFFEALYHTLVQGVSTFLPKVSDFIRPWRTPVALLGQRTLTASATSRAHSSHFGGGTCSWIAIFSSCDEAAFLFPDPPFPHKPVRLFNVFKHSRIISDTFSRILISYILVALGPSSTSHAISQTLFQGPCWLTVG